MSAKGSLLISISPFLFSSTCNDVSVLISICQHLYDKYVSTQSKNGHDEEGRVVLFEATGTNVGKKYINQREQVSSVERKEKGKEEKYGAGRKVGVNHH